MLHKQTLAAVLAGFLTILCAGYASGESTSGSISGTVLDPSGAVVTNATVEIHNPVSGYDRSTKTDAKGNFSFSNLPSNPYHMTITAAGFAQSAQDVEVRSMVPVSLKITLEVSTSAETVTVETAGDLMENDPDLPHRYGQEPCSTNFPWRANLRR